ncbi:hypothetical protein HYDPIDRAFT_113435 [Hydnomerulius pinastri MD-312]|uniref:Protein kinase domain-containing protein n=1 Tax=Hydnomerulius pinastri MD-312 TaxID=994086 RepID=A0A0C9WDX1_9AGAM|nr:hypothetical protein HYDPIDRAFT_113435 [Hydnomerulius pinastri MD-312]
MNSQLDGRGGLSVWSLRRGLHLVLQLLWSGGIEGSEEIEPLSGVHSNLGAIPLDLTGQIEGKGAFPTAIGIFSDVWKCDYTDSEHRKRPIAVKTIRGQSDDESLQEKSDTLRAEVERWKTLIHKNVLPVYGTTLGFSPLPSLVCPWVDGGSLTGHLETHPDLPYKKRLEILSQVSEGLCYLHSREVMHGDLSGANVLVHTNGTAYLADFGLLPIVLEFRSAPYLSTAIGGAVRWAAPELFEVSETGDDTKLQWTMRSDIYSFGSLMLQVLSGNIPYHEIKRDEQVLFAIAKGTKPPRPQNSRVKDEHWAFIQQCWSSLEENRRPSAREISLFLERLRSNQS